MRLKPKIRMFEVIDVDLAHVFYCGSDANDADSYKAAIEMQGHRAIIKEVTP